MIPKKIHYIWIGGSPKSKLSEICINSWKRILVDYEIVEWNEHNLPIDELRSKNKFLDQCFKLKLWAFVSDYLRLYILYEYGGIYLDTDVEILKSFTPLLDNRMFVGYEEKGFIGTGVIGAEAKNIAIYRLLEFYNEEIWNVEFINNPIIFRYLMEREPKLFMDCNVYPQEFFSPYIPGRSYENAVETKETYSIHWYTANWNMNLRGYVFINVKHIRSPFKKKIITIKKTIGYFKSKYFNIKKKDK